MGRCGSLKTSVRDGGGTKSPCSAMEFAPQREEMGRAGVALDCAQREHEAVASLETSAAGAARSGGQEARSSDKSHPQGEGVCFFGGYMFLAVTLLRHQQRGRWTAEAEPVRATARSTRRLRAPRPARTVKGAAWPAASSQNHFRGSRADRSGWRPASDAVYPPNRSHDWTAAAGHSWPSQPAGLGRVGHGCAGFPDG